MKQPLNNDELAEALKRCEGEPIQYIGSIQSHGVLLAIDSHDRIQVVSANLADVFGVPAQWALRRPALDVLGASAWRAVSEMVLVASQPQSVLLPIQNGDTLHTCQALVHQSGESLVIEVESPGPLPSTVRTVDFNTTDSLLNALLAESRDIETYAAVISDSVRTLTGYDRVMVYQFDDEWNGKVIAESRDHGVASFLGNHFPASDIPPPARALYSRNLVRILMNRDAPPAPLLHASAATGDAPLDLSFAILRSMSPVHLEYLKNLGVSASMSVSLMQNGRLWGLIACHHMQPRQLPLRLRQSLELVARTVATQLAAISFAESNRYYALVRNLLPRLSGLARVEEVSAGDTPISQTLQQEVLTLVNARGALIAVHGQSIAMGHVPSPAQCDALLQWLRPHLSEGRLFATHALARQYPAAAAFADVGSGLLAIALDNTAQQCILWFRQEVVLYLPWAGEAAKHLVHDALGPRLQPRHSFKPQVQTRYGESPPWSDPEVDAARMVSLTLVDLFSRHQLKIAATAFESQVGMIVTDPQGVILRVNQAFTHITEYSMGDVVGNTLRMLHSGRQDRAFYEKMWEHIQRDGAWQGEIWNRRKSGEAYPEWLSITAVRGGEGQVANYVGTFTDITERKAADQKIETLAFYDHLTQLPNRRLMLDRLGQALVSVTRRKRQGAVMMIDLDNFKTLNDTKGHAMGDLLLIQVAERLLSSIRAGDSVARLGGDEFVVILEDLADGPTGAMGAKEVGEKISAKLEAEYLLQVATEPGDTVRYSHYCTASIGIALFQDASASVDELIQRADTAMYQAKAAGRNALRFFDPDMQSAVRARAALEVDMRRALEEQQFRLYYQAQVHASGQVVGAEALVRWQHPVRGRILPGDFIALAEDTGLILPLGLWVLKTACAQLAAWAQSAVMQHLTLAVNVSARQFALPHFVDLVLETLHSTGAPAGQLKLELTESILVDNATEIIAKMAVLKSHGVRFSLDDFGTGYSSLSYLKRLPIDQLKIDKSFVRDITHDQNDAAIAKTIVSLGQNLRVSVIAEGVETMEQGQVLADLGCLVYQGYYFSHPHKLADFEAFVANHAGPHP